MKRKPREFSPEVACYIKDHSKYRKMTYGELKKMKELDPEAFSKRWFIPVGGALLEVGHQDYQDFYRDKERQDYLKALDEEYRAISYETLKEQTHREKEAISVKEVDIHKIVETSLLLEELKKALSRLNKDETALIKALYFEDQTVKAIANRRGVSIDTIYKQRKRILQKLRKMIKN
ncbi:sigma-70 family RNA polymerase sigma factor [Eubacterium callanderi]|uniref:sigma-70 family RNA polymerase sigma factor n=1 Tax=Eubacterium callanderi TaxID=53442 RepID=UPI001C2D2852|nr:sigma-70 family RNA polymerase sigma factor [Eubacterium callanderi]MBV1684203.1 sigma-70 family RNA polymerase sigma factor [Eubacterium callanderi]